MRIKAVMVPLIRAPSFLMLKPVGPLIGRIWPFAADSSGMSDVAEPAKAAVAATPDAAAAGAAMAVAITGTDHATPLITLRRLKPVSLLPSTAAFRISDKCAPM